MGWVFLGGRPGGAGTGIGMLLGFRRMDDKDGTVGVGDAGCAHGAQQQSVEAAVSATAYDQKRGESTGVDERLPGGAEDEPAPDVFGQFRTEGPGHGVTKDF